MSLSDSRSIDEAYSTSSRPASSPDSQVPLGEGARVCAHGWEWRHAGCKNAVLSGVDLDIAPDEHVLVLGPSGSGRSTLMGDLVGLLGDAEEGDVTDTLTVDGVTPAETRGHVGLLMQDLEAQVILARVDDDVAFGIENLGVAHGEIQPHVENSLEAAGLSVPLDHSTAGLSDGQEQRLAPASILAMSPGLLLLDEPTMSLNPSGIAEVRAAVETVAERTGATVVVTEHHVDVRASLVGHVIVVADGAIAADGPLDEVPAQQGDTPRERGIWLPGDDVAAKARPASEVPPTSSENPGGGAQGITPITRVTDLTIDYDASTPVHSGIDLMIRCGISTCVVGANGTEKSIFALMLTGLLPPPVGIVEVETADGTDGDPHEWNSKQLLGRMSMVFQEPGYQFLAATVAEEFAIGPRVTGMTDEEIAPLVDEHLEALGLTKLTRANPMTLSGGEKHRLSVATTLISASEPLIPDKSTFGQNRGTWLGLVHLLCAALEHGVTLVSITHDPAFVAAMGQRIVDLGQIGTCGTAPEDSTDEAGSAPTRNVHDCDPKHDARDFLVRTNPVARVLALLVATTPLLIMIDPVNATVAIILELAFMPLSGVSARSFFLETAPLLLAAPLGALSMLLYASPGGTVYWQFGPAAVSGHLMWLALGIGLRMYAIVLSTIALLGRIGLTDMGDRLTQILYLSARPMLTTLTSAYMTSLMATGWEAPERVRRTRDAGDPSYIRSFLRGSFSLLVFALRRSGELATTMEARGFGTEGERTWARPSRLRTVGAVLMVVATALPAIALATSVWAGTFAPMDR